MSEKMVKKFMSSVAFTQSALRDHIAPPSIGSIKARIRYASRKLGWSDSRIRECWYGRDRVRISADELRNIEEKTGLRYGREELRTNQDLIERATALMAGHEADFYSAFLTALRALARPSDRT